MIPPSEDEQKRIFLLYNVKKEPATVGTVAGESVGLPVLTGQPRSVRDNGNYIKYYITYPAECQEMRRPWRANQNITVKKIPPLRGLSGLVMGINFSTAEKKKAE